MEHPSQLPVTWHGVLAVGCEHLNPDVVRARLELGAQARSDTIGRAVQHQSVDEAVAAAAIEVGIGVAVAPKVIGVVDQLAQRFGFDRELRTRLIAIREMKPTSARAWPRFGPAGYSWPPLMTSPRWARSPGP